MTEGFAPTHARSRDQQDSPKDGQPASDRLDDDVTLIRVPRRKEVERVSEDGIEGAAACTLDDADTSEAP